MKHHTITLRLSADEFQQLRRLQTALAHQVRDIGMYPTQSDALRYGLRLAIQAIQKTPTTDPRQITI